VEEHDVSFLGLVEEVEETLDVDFLGFGVVVGVGFEVEAGTFDDVLMVGPGGVGVEDSCGKFLLDEFEANAESACA
jgi:hypothetical protein